MLPNGIKSLLKHQKPFSKSLFRLALKDLTAPKWDSKKDDSFYNFTERRFGTEIAKYIIDPMCRGIFAGNSNELSVNSFAKSIFDLEKNYGSVIKGFILEKFLPKRSKDVTEDLSGESELVKRAINEQWSTWSLEGGLSTLVTALENEIKNDVEIFMNCKVSEINMEGSKMKVSCNDQTFTVDKVISCLPANKLKPLVTNLNLDLAQVVGTIPFVDVVVVNLEYDENIIKEPGFGYLVPSCEPSKVLGVIYDSVFFPQENDHTIVTIMMGGHWFEKSFGTNPSIESLLDIATKEIQSTLGINAPRPCYSKVSILRQCIPQYTVGHLERVAKAKQILKTMNIPLYLAGNSFDGVAINDSIYNSRKVASAITK